MGTGCGRGRQVPQWRASSTTRPAVRLRVVLRWTSNRYGPNLAWSSHRPRAQKRHDPRAALAQNQHSKVFSYLGQVVRYATVVLPEPLLPEGSTAVTVTTI